MIYKNWEMSYIWILWHINWLNRKIVRGVTTSVLMESQKSIMKHGTDVKKRYRRLSKKNNVVRMKLKSITIIEWRNAEKIGQIMKEIHVLGQLFVDCLDLKISKELSEVQKSLRIQVFSFMKISAKMLWTLVNCYGRRYWVS